MIALSPAKEQTPPSSALPFLDDFLDFLHFPFRSTARRPFDLRGTRCVSRHRNRPDAIFRESDPIQVHLQFVPRILGYDVKPLTSVGHPITPLFVEASFPRPVDRPTAPPALAPSLPSFS